MADHLHAPRKFQHPLRLSAKAAQYREDCTSDRRCESKRQEKSRWLQSTKALLGSGGEGPIPFNVKLECRITKIKKK
jgi:hypothetical protein